MKTKKNNKKNYHTPRRFPYYKIQILDNKVAAWIDIQKTFYELDDLRTYAREKCAGHRKVRIIKVEGEGSRCVFGILQIE